LGVEAFRHAWLGLDGLVERLDHRNKADAAVGAQFREGKRDVVFVTGDGLNDHELVAGVDGELGEGCIERAPSGCRLPLRGNQPEGGREASFVQAVLGG
jgi:hypothetical protein